MRDDKSYDQCHVILAHVHHSSQTTDLKKDQLVKHARRIQFTISDILFWL